jgi:hypothetical protein
MYVATRGLGITGGHADINGWSHSLDLPGYAEIADGVDEVRKAVRGSCRRPTPASLRSSTAA